MKTNNQKNSSNIIPTNITREMESSYLDYAMSVIVSRALPDVRDGLKPVQRRILYAMHEVGLGPQAKFRKSATVIGAVLGQYHPHGDASVYETLVRMAQDFSLRYPLITGQGNMGSLDGDAPAAMRYTETKLAPVASTMLADIEKDTVDWRLNYDGTRQEPIVLPALLPQLLINGSVGIAVGMATTILPHNLGEILDASIALINNPDLTIEELMQCIKGPDFPTGGIVYNRKAILQAYAQGRGPIEARAKVDIEDSSKKEQRIVVTEMTYQVNKARLLEHIAELVKNERVKGIKAVRDESNKEGVRVVIELKKDAQPNRVLNQLYAHTDLQKTFHVNMLALVNGLQPKVLSLKEMLEEYLSHRTVVVERRTRYELKQAQKRIHILEGLVKALTHIDNIIQTIKRSKDRAEAQKNLEKKFKLTRIQADAILKMQLAALARLEQEKVELELKNKLALVKKLKEILENKKVLMKVVREEIEALKKTYSDPRRTEVREAPLKDFSEEMLIQEEAVFVTLTKDGYIKRTPLTQLHKQHRGGKGMVGVTTREDDVVEQLLYGSTNDWILFFTNQGRVFRLRAFEIPEGARAARGKPLAGILQLAPREEVTTALIIPKEKLKNASLSTVTYIVMATENGIIKKTPLSEFTNIRRNGLIAIRLKSGDALRWTRLTSGQQEIFITSKQGNSIRFSEKDVVPTGRASQGVIGLRLRINDRVRSMERVGADNDRVLIITEKGFGKLTPLKSFRLQKRGGKGIKAVAITERTGPLVGAKLINKEISSLLLISQQGKVIQTTIKAVPTRGRVTQGVYIMRPRQNDKIASFVVF